MEIEEQKTTAPLNADIEGFLMNAGFLEIHFEFGLAEYFRYLEELQLLSMGVKYKDLGIAERRHSSLPKLIRPAEIAAGYQFVDKWDIMDEADTPAGSIALLKLQGVMRSSSSLSSPGIDRLATDLRNAYANENVVGVIVETNSGGGESVAGNMLKTAMRERNKPVVGFAHLAASAAYRGLSGADEIIAAGDSAEFGSIGTMVSLNRQLLKKYAKQFLDFYGKDAPGKNADFRDATGGNFEKIQARVDDLTLQFQQEIKRDRNLQGDKAMIQNTVDGSVFNAVESKKRGLIDMIGNMQTAVKRIKSLRSKY